MKKIIFATQNEGKMGEIRKILVGSGWELLSMKEAGIDIDIVEDGETFEENAIIKVKAVASFLPADSGYIVLGDDSGLEVDYLNKEPGVFSARYAGREAPYPVKMQKILDRLAGVADDKRSARFVCVIAAILPSGEIICTRETIEGMIGHEPVGEKGFGYDPIFYLPEYACTTAELPMEQKNQLSHRGKALRAMRARLESV